MTPELLNNYLLTIILTSLLFNAVISLYGVFFKPHFIKKVIALTILSDTVNAIGIYIGYRTWYYGSNPRPPILLTTQPSPQDIEQFMRLAVDPLPQALVLTAVVIGLATTLFLVFLGYILYTHYGTLDMREIKKLKG